MRAGRIGESMRLGLVPGTGLGDYILFGPVWDLGMGEESLSCLIWGGGPKL
jgi:hypothetical protein